MSRSGAYARLSGIAILLAALAVSCSKGLTREAAATMIEKRTEFSAPITVVLHVGVGQHGEDRYYKSFERLGFLKAERVQLHEYSGGGSLPLGRLTPKGEAATQSWTIAEEREPYGNSRNTTFLVNVASRSLVEVTGIAEQPGGSEALVKFNYKYIENPAVGQIDELDFMSVHEAAAYVKRYDDGWRIEKFDNFH
jgi:hypothetical protein